jgi:hypothetical protein
MLRPSPLRTAVAIGCVYELLALPDRSPLPTISSISQRGASHRRFRFLSWAWAGYAAAHMLGLDAGAYSGRHLRFICWLLGGYGLAIAFKIADA